MFRKIGCQLHRDDELIEITPSSTRLRKRHLDPHERKRASQNRKKEA